MWQFYLNSILLGVGLAMDACAVSMANGLNEPKMRLGKTTLIAFMFGFFQAMMPMIGWVCVHFIAEQFEVFNKAVPYIALALLAFIGGKMIFEGFKEGREKKTSKNTQTPDEISAENGETTDLPTEVKSRPETVVETVKKLTLWVLITQAVATSIDALSVGFTIAEYAWWEALLSAAIIAVVTFAISFGAVFIGKKFGTKLGNKAEILGGFILIGIGLEIFITGVFF